MTVGMSPERLKSARREVVAWLARTPDSSPISPVTTAELLDEVDRQAEEIKALRLHVRVSGEHYKALGVEVGPEHIETDATARGLKCERPPSSFSGTTFVTHRVEGWTVYAFDAQWREDSVCLYANAIAAEHGVSALDVLDALAEQARADKAPEKPAPLEGLEVEGSADASLGDRVSVAFAGLPTELLGVYTAHPGIIEIVVDDAGTDEQVAVTLLVNIAATQTTSGTTGVIVAGSSVRFSRRTFSESFEPLLVWTAKRVGSKEG